MVGLPRQVGARVVIDAIFLKAAVTQIRPQHRHHAKLMRALKRGRNFFNLAARLFGAEINRRPDRHRAHIEGLFDARIQRLVVLRRVAQGFVMVNLHQERNAVRVAARHRRQHAVGGGHAVAARFNRQLDNVFRVEIHRVRGKRRARRMLDALVHRQNGEISGAGEASGIIKGLHISQHRGWTVVINHHAIDIIRPWQIELVGGNGRTAVL